jgi:NNP family nitrate/nitrite transporter-like MFS transporter
MVPMAVVLLIFAFVRARVRVVTRLQHSRITLPFYGNPMAMRGMGNGAVFPLVPQRFPQRTGLVTGVVGAAGGLGGFLLPSLLGLVRDVTRSYSGGLYGCAAAFLCGTVMLLELGTRWTQRWELAAAQRAGVYSYRARLSLDDEGVA